MTNINNETQTIEIIGDVLRRRQMVSGFGQITVDTPVGITTNVNTGVITPPLTITRGSDPVITAINAFNNRVIIQGLIFANVSANNMPIAALQNLQIPFTIVIDVPGLGSHADVNIQDFRVIGFTAVGITTEGESNIIFTALFQACVFITEQAPLTIEADILRCGS